VTRHVQLVFETHSLTTDNERGVATGWLGGTLSVRGRSLAAGLGERRRDDVDVVLCSDLARAVETARIAFEDTQVPVLLDWRLREVDYGELNGSRVELVERERPHRVDIPYPAGESYRDATRRVAEALDDLVADHGGRRVLVIGHTATRWALDHLVAGRRLEELVAVPFEWREGWEYRLEPRAVTTAGTA
jgi:broad specificity phosphatase PhoE